MDGVNKEVPQGTASELIENYGAVLDAYIPDVIKNSNTPPRILSVACGFGLELKGLTTLLPDAHIEAMDSANVAIVGARGFNPDFPQDRIRMADATKKESFGDEDWDLIMVRNPKIGIPMPKDNGIWAEILGHCFDRVKVNGFLYLTTPSSSEMREVLAFYSKLPLQDVTPIGSSLDHLIRPPLAVSFPLREDYIAILKKVAI